MQAPGREASAEAAASNHDRRLYSARMPAPCRPQSQCTGFVLLAVAVALTISGCGATPEPPGTSARAPATKPSQPPVAKPVPAPAVSEAQWREAVARHIQQRNAAKVFEGRPPHPLKAIVVLELTVSADGRVERASVLRTPSHARELGDEAVRTVRTAAPLPAPPRPLLRNGSYRFSETWLFRQDNRFQLRTLAQEQLLD